MSKVRRFLSSMGGQNAASAILAVIAGLIAGFIILLISNPPQAGAGFVTILTGGFSDMFNLGMVLYFATPLILTGLSVGFAMKTGLFNIGASGQFTFGIFMSVFIARLFTASFPDINGVLLTVCAVIAGMLAGAVWGMIPGILKAYRNVHEVISCIMMNYIGMYLVNYLAGATDMIDILKNVLRRAPGAAELPKLGLDKLFSSPIVNAAGEITSYRVSSVGSGILIAVAASITLYIVLERTKFGYELKACGYNRDASRYAGINENRGIILSMTIAGGMAGIGGAMVALAGSGYDYSIVDVLASEGFLGIPVALLGLSNPLGIIFSGFLISYLTQSGFLLQRNGYAPEVVEIIISVIIYFSALALLLKGFIQFVIKERKDVGSGSDSNGELQGITGQARKDEDYQGIAGQACKDDKPAGGGN